MSRSIIEPLLVMMRRRCFGRGSVAAGVLAFDGCAPDSVRADDVPDSPALRLGVRAGRLRVAGFGVAALDSFEFVAPLVTLEGWPDELAAEVFAPVSLAPPFEFFASSVSDFAAFGCAVEAGVRVRRGAVLAPALPLAAEEVVRLAGVGDGAGVGVGSAFASSFGAAGSSMRAPVEVVGCAFLSRDAVSFTVGAVGCCEFASSGGAGWNEPPKVM